MIVVVDGKVIEEGNCFSTNEVIERIIKIIRNVDFAANNVSSRIGNGSSYKELLEEVDEVLPPQVVLKVMSETETNKPLKENERSRGVRHIASTNRIDEKVERIISRRKTIATHN